MKIMLEVQCTPAQAQEILRILAAAAEASVVEASTGEGPRPQRPLRRPRRRQGNPAEAITACRQPALAYLVAHPGSKTDTIARALAAAQVDVRAALIRMEREGLTRREGRTKATRWFATGVSMLTPAAST